ncbi:MBL fold metallo-hydrolase [Rhodovibrionaceae bacterium A322]
MERASAADWYDTRKMGDDVTHIFEPFITDYYRCNIWHVRGRDRDLLVDSGMGVVSLRQQVPLVTEKSCLAVASHSHFDHIGCHHEFDERLIHQEEAEILARPTRGNTLADCVEDAEVFTKLPPAPYRADLYAVQAAPATRLLQAGDVLDLGDRSFEIIHTPGHSPGSIMLYEASRELLFAGDTIYDGPLADDLYHSNLDDYIASLERIVDLPVRVVHGGHFPSFDGKRYGELIRQFLRSKA